MRRQGTGPGSKRESAEAIFARLGPREPQLTPEKGTPPIATPESAKALAELVGLANVKTVFREIEAFHLLSTERSRLGLRVEYPALHMIFKGNPGTGKTTVARLVAASFRQIGLLPKGHLVEVERADLVGEFVGHTAQKTREQIRRSLGGILFVDEAYSLARGGDRDFGRESIETLVKEMEDHRGEFILILAGYRREMEEFLASNPGLRSRFPIQLDFPDYTVEELMQIAERFLSQKEYRLSPEAKQILKRRLAADTDTASPPNARTVRNLLEAALRKQALRLLQTGRPVSREDLIRLEASDIIEAEAGKRGAVSASLLRFEA